jgi:pSer/pThr/pTyr-binding forkhead associated (FHA) protein
MAGPAQSVLLQLLATAHGQPLQTWEFVDQHLIQIGRATDCEVVISSPVVSRSHAYLKRDGAGWELCCVSQNGVYVDGVRVPSLHLVDGAVFRLAATGPFLRFRQLQENRSMAMETIPPDQSGMSPLLLDEDNRDRQVDAIADGQYFQHLQELARQLRNRP